MKILVLAGGFDQIALINELKSRNHEVILADYFENPPAKKYADRHFQTSTLDEEAIYQLAKDQKVDLITTACTDQALLTVAKVSERLALPCYISYETALHVTNKEYMKKIFVENDIPTAKYSRIKELVDIEVLQKEVNYPVVVKPCDCNSSKGVIKAVNDQEMQESVEAALAMSRSHTAIVEEFKEGIELSVDVWVDREGAKVLSASTTSKIEANTEAFTIYQSKYPVEITEVAKTKIQKTAQKIANAFHLMDCPILIQLIVQNNDIYVIEFSARMGGGTKYLLIEEMSGVDIMKIYTNRILGNVNQIVKPEPSKKLIELNYVYARNGVYKRLVNYEEALQAGIIKNYFVYKEAGAIIEKHTTSSDRIAGFLIEAATKAELYDIRKQAIEMLDILDENNQSMMIKDIYYE